MILQAARIPALLILCGASTVFAFAPTEIPGLMFAALAALFWALQSANGARSAACRGFFFGLGYFCANVHWVYISLHEFGGMPGWMAGGCVIALAACLALFPALAGWLSRSLPCPERWRLPLLIPAIYLLLEWLRGWIFTGFPWATTGSSQVGLLAGWFPLLGAYGVGALVALTSALALYNWRMGALALLSLCLGSIGLQQIQWTSPLGSPVSVSLVRAQCHKPSNGTRHCTARHSRSTLT
jgi:apolipoprotein N-acyltransferase